MVKVENPYITAVIKNRTLAIWIPPSDIDSKATLKHIDIVQLFYQFFIKYSMFFLRSHQRMKESLGGRTRRGTNLRGKQIKFMHLYYSTAQSKRRRFRCGLFCGRNTGAIVTENGRNCAQNIRNLAIWNEAKNEKPFAARAFSAFEDICGAEFVISRLRVRFLLPAPKKQALRTWSSEGLRFFFEIAVQGAWRRANTGRRRKIEMTNTGSRRSAILLKCEEQRIGITAIELSDDYVEMFSAYEVIALCIAIFIRSSVLMIYFCERLVTHDPSFLRLQKTAFLEMND